MSLDDVTVEPSIHELRPDFAVLAVAATGLVGGPTDEQSEARLRDAEAAARRASPDNHPHLSAWREAYRAFGAKPQRTLPSVEALWRRAAAGDLPRVHWLVDLYNAVSVEHALPVGGEDLAAFHGPLRLVRATGHERFETVKNGAPHIEHPDTGEVVWLDDLGVTCRRWNWRQGTRTRLGPDSAAALFLFERLSPLSLDALDAAADGLERDIRTRCPDAKLSRRRLGPWA